VIHQWGTPIKPYRVDARVVKHHAEEKEAEKKT
jgi:hypothetical protein